MNIADATPSGSCSGCGRVMAKAHRKYNGERFCATCYARLFKRRLCPACGSFARLPFEEIAICRRCESSRPCVRCGAAGRSVGLMTKYGPVCNACRPHFVVPKPCGECGKPSNRLSRVSRLELRVQVCPLCARRDFATCQGCRRHRLLAKAEDGRMLCKVCNSVGTVNCPDCGELMPAGRRNRCESCYWHAVHNKRVQLDQAALATSRCAELFAEFGAWLQGRVGGQRAALRIHRYLPFFIDIDQRWGEIPTYTALLAHCGAEGLRRFRLPMKWLAESHRMKVNTIEREADSEYRRISALLALMPAGTVGASALAAYQDRQQTKVEAGTLTIRSMRLALRPAASLLLAADASGHALPDQVSVDHFLRKAPGQLTALGGFIRFLNRHYALDLLAAADEQAAAARRRKNLEVKLIALAQSGDRSGCFLRKWVSIGLAYFHGLPSKLTRWIPSDAITIDADGYRVSINGQEYWLPRPDSVTRTAEE